MDCQQILMLHWVFYGPAAYNIYLVYTEVLSKFTVLVGRHAWHPALKKYHFLRDFLGIISQTIKMWKIVTKEWVGWFMLHGSAFQHNSIYSVYK